MYINDALTEIGDNYKWFRDNIKKLNDKYYGSWVVIFNKKVVYSNASSLRCYDYVIENNIIGRATIQRCVEN